MTWKAVLSPSYSAFGSTATQTVSASNTTTLINFDSVFESNRVSVNTSGVGYSTRIYVHEPGVYNFQFSAQVDTVTTNQSSQGEFWFKKNGVDVPDSNSLITINGKDDENLISLNFVSIILPHEYIELYYSSSRSDFRLLSLENLTSPTRPNIPSVIFTVTPVSNILPSTGIAISGIASINNETGPYQSLIVGSSGNDFVISSSSNTHTFNLPSASATARGLVTTTTQTFAGDKTFTGIVNATNITNSTSTTTGAAIVTGGLGVGGNAFIGGTVTAPLFTGNLSATAATATNFYGNLIGTATTATYSHQSGYAITAGLATTANYSHQSGFAITAGLATTATYSHQSGYAITSGLATTATYSHQSGFAITAGLATTSTNVNVASSGNTDSSHFLLFSRFNIGAGLAVSSAIGLSYTPSTGVLIGTTFQGNLQGNVLGNLTGTASTATYAHQSGYAITSGLATTATYSHQSGYAITSGSATTASYAHQSGYAITTGTATTASNTNLVLNTSATANHPITFTPSTTTVSGGAQS